MKVRVEGSVCQGHTLCAMTAPDLFALREEDGHAQVVSEDVPANAGRARPRGGPLLSGTGHRPLLTGGPEGPAEIWRS